MPDGSPRQSDAGTQSLVGPVEASHGKIIVPGKYVSAAKQRSAAQESIERLSESLLCGETDENGRPISRMSEHDLSTSLISKGADSSEAIGAPGATSLSATQLPKVSATDPSPYLLPLQRVYAPTLLLNHAKAMFRSTVRIAPNTSLLGKSSSGEERSKSSLGLHSGDESRMGTSHSRLGTAPSRMSTAISGRVSPSKFASSGIPEDGYQPSAKELREVKELIRHFDTDATGFLSVEKMRQSLYFNNVDYEEITDIFGPRGLKVRSYKQQLSVEETAIFLCRRRHENAKRQQDAAAAEAGAASDAANASETAEAAETAAPEVSASEAAAADGEAATSLEAATDGKAADAPSTVDQPVAAAADDATHSSEGPPS